MLQCKCLVDSVPRLEPLSTRWKKFPPSSFPLLFSPQPTSSTSSSSSAKGEEEEEEEAASHFVGKRQRIPLNLWNGCGLASAKRLMKNREEWESLATTNVSISRPPAKPIQVSIFVPLPHSEKSFCRHSSDAAVSLWMIVFVFRSRINTTCCLEVGGGRWRYEVRIRIENQTRLPVVINVQKTNDMMTLTFSCCPLLLRSLLLLLHIPIVPVP